MDMTNYKTMTLNIHNKIAHIELSRPQQFNSMNGAFWLELPDVVKQISNEAKARVIVVSSTGKHFCAGMDVSLLSGNAFIRDDAELGRRHEDLRRTVLQLQQAINELEKARMPVLAAVQGGCIGGAVDMVSACDSRYCTEDAFFCVEETKLGMVADLGTLQRLPQLIAPGLARELIYTGRRMYADEAKQCGLVNAVYTDSKTMIDGVMHVAEQIAARSPLTIAGCKEMINYARDHSMADSLNVTSLWQSGMLQQADLVESFTAKAEKREPTYDALCEVRSPTDID